MLDTVIFILNKYISEMPIRKLYSIEVIQVDIEDTVYLIQSKVGDFAVYETDFFISVEQAIETLKSVSKDNDYTFQAVQYLKDSLSDEIIYTTKNQRYKYIVATIKNTQEKSTRFSPSTYGS